MHSCRYKGPSRLNPQTVCQMSRALFVCSGLDSASTCILMIFFCHSATLSLLLSSYSYSLSLYLYCPQLAILVQLTRRRTSASKADPIHTSIDSYPLIRSSLCCLRIRTASSYYPASLHTLHESRDRSIVTGLTSSTLFTFNFFNLFTLALNSLRCCLGKHQDPTPNAREWATQLLLGGFTTPCWPPPILRFFVIRSASFWHLHRLYSIV